MMTPDLILAIERGRTSVGRPGDHDLWLGLRQLLYRSLGLPRLTGLGYRRRVLLAALTAEYVLPLWSRKHPKDHRPQRMLQASRAFAAGDRAAKADERARLTFWDDLVAVSYREKDQRAAAAGMCAVQAARVAFFDDGVPEGEIDEGLRDNMVDADDMDYALFASAAASGGAFWEPRSNANLRKRFWLWWLESAVRSAVEGAPE